MKYTRKFAFTFSLSSFIRCTTSQANQICCQNHRNLTLHGNISYKNQDVKKIHTKRNIVLIFSYKVVFPAGLIFSYFLFKILELKQLSRLSDLSSSLGIIFKCHIWISNRAILCQKVSLIRQFDFLYSVGVMLRISNVIPVKAPKAFILF